MALELEGMLRSTPNCQQSHRKTCPESEILLTRGSDCIQPEVRHFSNILYVVQTSGMVQEGINLEPQKNSPNTNQKCGKNKPCILSMELNAPG